MNILYTTDDKFVGKVGASICSVFDNNKSMEQISVYIIGQDISKENRRKLKELSQIYRRSIEIIELENLKNYFDFEFDTSGWNQIVLARLLLDKLLPDYIERIIYLDGDTINISNLQSLWETDLNGKVLGACIEATVDQKRKIDLEMDGIPYINAGVLLFDLKRWKEEHCFDRIMEYYRRRGGRLFANDQDVINAVLKESIYYLPPKYNFYNIYWFYPYSVLKKLMGKAVYYEKEIFTDSLDNPAIIHYLGEERPWRKGNHHKFKKHFQLYHSKTPWKDEAMEEGWGAYFLCWDIFNKILHPFPMLRYRIINVLIPWFMIWRKKQLNKEKRQAKK